MDRDPDSVVRSLAEEIRVALIRKRISQSAAAAAAGISQSSMSRRLAGAQPFTIDEVYRLADLLGISTAELLETAKAGALETAKAGA